MAVLSTDKLIHAHILSETYGIFLKCLLYKHRKVSLNF